MKRKKQALTNKYFSFAIAIIAVILFPCYICHAEGDDIEPEDEVRAYYIIQYFQNNTDDDNLIFESDKIYGTEDDLINISEIDKNSNKPEDTKSLIWSDGEIQEGFADKYKTDGSAIIKIVYKSSPINYSVKYYYMTVNSKNLIKIETIDGEEGDEIDIEAIDKNAYKPENKTGITWADGVIQDNYPLVITKDNSDIINIIYYPTYCDVTEFGADGSDESDDTSAIQKALDYSSANSYANYELTVYIPAGTYYISSTLYIQPNTTLKLDPNAIIVRSNKALSKNMLKNTYNSKHLSLYKNSYNVASNIHVTGGIWDGGDIYNATGTCNLIYFGHARNIVIDDTTIKNCYGSHAIEFAGVKDSSINNCKITGFRYNPSEFTSEAIQLDVCYKDDADGDWAPGFEADKTTCTNITITNCTITDYPRGIGVHHTLKGYECSDIIIKNNSFIRSSVSTQGKAVAGIFLLGAKNVTIMQNNFERYSYGALIKTSSNLTIKNNIFRYNNISCLSLSGCDKNNGNRSFTIKDKSKLSDKLQKKYKKKFIFSSPGIKSGTFKVKGKSYKYSTGKTEKKVTLKKNISKNVSVSFYGKDSWGNKYYQTKKTPAKYKIK